jgi:hypothetical protein
MEQITQKATEFAISYKAAMELSLSPTSTREQVAAALASHYKQPGFISFNFGSYAIMEDQYPGAIAESGIATHLSRFEKSGLGYRIRGVKHEIQPYSESSAQAWLTWEIEPQNDTPGWQWTNIYGFRIGQNGKAFWEYCVSDHEIAGVLQRCPNFFELS